MARSRWLALDNFQQFTAINVLSDPGHIGGPVVIPSAVKWMPVWQLANGKQARSVLYMTVASGFNPTAAIAESMRAALVAGSAWSGLAGFLAPTTQLLRVDLQDVRAPNLPIVSSTGAATPGTSSGTALPDEVALVITLRTNKTGPAARGRYYQPGWASNAIGAGGIVAAAAVTALTNFAGNLSGATIAAPGTWVIGLPARAAYTGATGTQHPARPAGTIQVTAALCRDNHWDSQRRRGLK